MKILETVTGSNQRLIQPQTVGKKAGAPTIWTLLGWSIRNGFSTHKDTIKGFRIMRSRQNTSILHMVFQIPELGQSYASNIDNVGRVRNGYLGVGSF